MLTFWALPLYSASQETPILRKWHESINKQQENAVTSCLASETESDIISYFTIVSGILRNPFLQYYGPFCCLVVLPSAVLPFLSNPYLRGSTSISDLRLIPTYLCWRGDDPESIRNHLSKLHETFRNLGFPGGGGWFVEDNPVLSYVSHK